MLRAKKLTAQQTAKLLRTFYETHGADAMRAAYGWESAPEVGGRYERAWAFYAPWGPGDDEQSRTIPVLIGWGSMDMNTRDAQDDEAVLTVGVFPAHQRQGYRAAILEWLARRAKTLGADRATMWVRKDNERHYARIIRETQGATSGWQHAGEIWFPPPGAGYFVYPLGETGTG